MLTKEQYDQLKAKQDLTDEEKAQLAEYEKAEKEKNIMIPKTRLDEEIQKRKEYEQKNKELNDRLDAIEKAQRLAEEKRLTDEKNFETLYNNAKVELEGLKPKAGAADEYEKTLQSVLETQVAELPETMRGLVPEEMSTNQKLAWLAKNKPLLLKKEPFDIGAGKGGGGNISASTLTQEELTLAKKAGMTPEEYAKYK